MPDADDSPGGPTGPEELEAREEASAREEPSPADPQLGASPQRRCTARLGPEHCATLAVMDFLDGVDWEAVSAVRCARVRPAVR